MENKKLIDSAVCFALLYAQNLGWVKKKYTLQIMFYTENHDILTPKMMREVLESSSEEVAIFITTYASTLQYMMESGVIRKKKRDAVRADMIQAVLQIESLHLDKSFKEDFSFDAEMPKFKEEN